MLSQRMKAKQNRSKRVGHDRGCVVPHSLMDEWIGHVERLEITENEQDPNEALHTAIALCQEDPAALELLKPNLKKLINLIEELECKEPTP